MDNMSDHRQQKIIINKRYYHLIPIHSKTLCLTNRWKSNKTTTTTTTIMSGSKLILDKALRSAVHLPSSKLPTEVAKSSAALFSALADTSFVLPDLAYDYDALEPAISAETMTLHHSKHHQTYITNLNATLEKMHGTMASGDVSGTIALQGALKFNGGGHVNHTLFWENLAPAGSSPFPTSGPLAEAVEARFGSYEAMVDTVSAKTIAVQGSGWGWLAYDPATKSIDVAALPNQDPLEATTGLKPLLGIDVWEHAYYVDYRNVRPSYVKAIWDVINWEAVESRLVEASK
jgi:Fe-Mn family superoxide dismutase